MNLISVIIPVFNSKDYITKCLDSLLTQSYSNFEIIIVDDGSNDGSELMCDEYAIKDNRFKVLHKQNGGVSSARNYGLQMASGDWICFVDSDDYLQSNYLQILVDGICDNSSLVILNDSQNVKTGIFYEQDMIDSFLKKDVIARTEPFCKLFLRKIIDDNLIRFNERVHMGEDALFLFEYLNCIEKLTIKRGACSYFYNRREGSLSKKYYSFNSEFECFLKWYGLMSTFVCKYSDYDYLKEKLIWESRTATTFLRVIQCLRRHKPAYSYFESMKKLDSIPMKYTFEFGTYYSSPLFRRRINAFLIKKRYFTLLWIYSLFDRKKK